MPPPAASALATPALAASAPLAPTPAATAGPGGNGAAYRLLALAVLLFGGVWPITKSALADATPLWFATGRAGFAALGLMALVAWQGRLRLPAREDWPVVAAIGLLQLAGFFSLGHLALALVPAGRTAVVANATTIWVVPLSVLLLGERMTPRRWLAGGLGLLGVASLAGLFTPGAMGGGAGSPLGYALLLGAALSWSLAIVALRARPPRRPVVELLPWCFVLAALVLGALALWREPAGGIGRSSWPALLFVGLVAAPLGTWATVEVQRRLSPLACSVGFLLMPVVGLLLAAAWLGEALGPDVLAGTALIVASVAIMARER
ncbi:DMT family transporter [Roseomonas sp. NAR14]|uniref:DMT family transporter n=1 Tax=Roseomonas acroporae TaxID=2937791 RepID=A0A9X1Y8C0_9PROT|nr:DMT family transporter [Roseomonas acroporae]MCK8785784.1 DMT family transporter [Roseomonas acroporae]